MGKDTKIEFVSQIFRKLWGIEYLAHLAQTAILMFAYMAEKLLKVLKQHFSDSYDMIWNVKTMTSSMILLEP